MGCKPDKEKLWHKSAVSKLQTFGVGSIKTTEFVDSDPSQAAFFRPFN